MHTETLPVLAIEIFSRNANYRAVEINRLTMYSKLKQNWTSCNHNHVPDKLFRTTYIVNRIKWIGVLTKNT